MRITRENLLERLPAYLDKWVVIHEDQSVPDIIDEVLRSHKEFAHYYDQIALYFSSGSVPDICQRIYDFLKTNIRYVEESADDQTSAAPQGLLTRGYGDCKHFAGFAGGILSAIERTGKKIVWKYRFASYHLFDKMPHHVFIVVWDKDNEIWIDPTPLSAKLNPYWIQDKKVNAGSMALRRNIAGMGDVAALNPSDFVTPVETDSDNEIPLQVIDDIKILMHYGILNEAAEFNEDQLSKLQPEMSEEEYLPIFEAYHRLHSASQVAGFFTDIWHGVKKVSLALPRNAYLSLVGLNVFGYGTKLWNAMHHKDGSEDASALDKLYKLWHDKLAGDWTSFLNTVNHGKDKKPVLGGASVGVAPVAAAWALTAAVIISAMTPLLKSLLSAKAGDMHIADTTAYPYGICPDGITPKMADGTCPGGAASGGFAPITWIKNNPLIAFAGAAVIINFLLPKPKRFIKI